MIGLKLKTLKTAFIFLIVSLSVDSSVAHGVPPLKAYGCQGNKKLQSRRSAELLDLAAADQADRQQPYDLVNWDDVNLRDLRRRLRVGEIFGEGCFKVASDFASAAIIYQHGVTPEHYYQAFIWANQAVKLGRDDRRWLMAAALDRYLVSTGYKQLFGTQFSRKNSAQWCVEAIESSFPEARRIEFARASAVEQARKLLAALGSDQLAEEIEICDSKLHDTPCGTILGFW